MTDNIILFDDPQVRDNLLPLTFTRPVAEFRVGIHTLRLKWESLLKGRFSYLTAEYLNRKFPCHEAPDNLFIAGHIWDTDGDLAAALLRLEPGEALTDGDTLLAFRGTLTDFVDRNYQDLTAYGGDYGSVNMIYDVFLKNGDAIRTDFGRLDKSDATPLSPTNTVIGNAGDIYIAPGAKVEGAFLNTTAGPIYIGEGAEVMEGSCLRGPVAVCAHSTVNMGTKVYPATTIGPWSKVGGELNNAVIFGYSNKAHDGFLGNAVIGEWCNLGAGCVASNLKNDYTPIKLWNYPQHRFLKTGLQFCGLIMADHSKAGINTMFNTATTVGVGCNIHGSGFPRNFIPSFSEGGTAGFTDVLLSKFYDIASRVMARRGRGMDDDDRAIFDHIFTYAEKFK